MEELAHAAYGVLTSEDRPTQNVTEWAKREACWTQMRGLAWSPAPALTELLVPLAKDGEGEVVEVSETMSGALPEDDPVVQEVSDVDGDAWLALSNWAKQTGNLSGWERRFAFTIGIQLKRDKSLTPKQANIAKRILSEVRGVGYEPSGGNEKEQ